MKYLPNVLIVLLLVDMYLSFTGVNFELELALLVILLFWDVKTNLQEIRNRSIEIEAEEENKIFRYKKSRFNWWEFVMGIFIILCGYEMDSRMGAATEIIGFSLILRSLLNFYSQREKGYQLLAVNSEGLLNYLWHDELIKWDEIEKYTLLPDGLKLMNWKSSHRINKWEFENGEKLIDEILDKLDDEKIIT